MNDLIYREQAINAVDIGNLHRGIVEALQNIISELPSAEKTGKWIDHQLGRWVYAKCSKCGSVHDVRSNYCPSCGARMVE